MEKAQMKYDIGVKICWTGDYSGRTIEIFEGTITKTAIDYIWVNNQHNPEDCIYKAYIWPFELKEKLLEVLKVRASLLKQYDDAMKLVYQLRNSISVA